MSSLQFLQEAIEELSCQGNGSFIEKVVERTLCDVIKETPKAIDLPSKTSILLELWNVSPRLAYQWYALRGPEAWSGTAKTLFPLASLLEDPNRRYEELPDGMGVGRSTLVEHLLETSESNISPVRDLLMSGLVYAMPLTRGGATDNTRDEQFLAQAQVVETLLRITESAKDSAQEKRAQALWKSFDLSDGALVFLSELGGNKINQERAPWKPDAPIWWRKAGDDGGFKPFVWHELWANQVNSAWEIKTLVPWLKRHGIDTHAVEKHGLALGVEAAAMSSSGTPKERWARICEILDKGGWGQENEKGLLLWQNALVIDERLLSAIIDHPPPGGLAQKSSNGKGLWDSLGLYGAVKLPRAQVGRLLKKCPPSTLSPIFPTQSWSATADLLMTQSLADHPRAWLGKPGSKQDSWATALLGRALQDENFDLRDRAEKHCALFLSTPAALDCLGPLPRGVLWVCQHLAQSDPDSELGKTPPIDKPAGNWAGKLIKSNKLLSSRKERTALSLLKKIQLESMVKTVRPAAPGIKM